MVTRNGPNENVPAPDPQASRRELQAILGQLHGLLSALMEHPEQWCDVDLVEPMKAAHAEISKTFGTVQADLNSGRHDGQLDSHALAGATMEPKKKGFRSAIQRFFASWLKGERSGEGITTALRWGGVIVGSVASMLPAAEAIKESVESIQAAWEQFSEGERSTKDAR
jgi:hypothetical protein